MQAHRSTLARMAELLHHRLLWLVLGAYALAAFAPGAGLWLRGLNFGDFTLVGARAPVTLPSVLLAVLLFNAGLGVEAARLRSLVRRPGALLAGLAANLLVPALFILGMSQSLRLWHNPTEAQFVLVGLALVASMPVAGSSTAWSQNANGDVALSLGLVVFSTLLSPITTPAVMHAASWFASGDYALALDHLAAAGTRLFMTAFILVPSLAGITAAVLLGAGVIRRTRPVLKLANMVTLLALIYANASAALPQTVANPDWDFLTIILVIVVGLCTLMFACGWLVARWTGVDWPQRTALIFGLGMNNNGTGLVLAATTLASMPEVMLPVIFYNLVQHAVAAVVDRLNRPTTAGSPDTAPSARRAA